MKRNIKNNAKKFLIIPAVLVTLSLAACGTNAENNENISTNNSAQNNAQNSEENTATFKQISQEEAQEMMTKDDGHIVLDVRRKEEYVAGHIPNAVLLPNEEIEDEMPAQLPDKDQIILIYCRSGNRSKQAAQKLVDMGYTNIYEFGGIIEWTGPVDKGE